MKLAQAIQYINLYDSASAFYRHAAKVFESDLVAHQGRGVFR
jgi:hypothetical protein